MIIVLKNADFSANNVGRITIPGSNLNIGEGTNNPLLFKYNNATGSGEFLGVDFITKTNPTPFPIVRRLHRGGTMSNLYSFMTADRTTIDFPSTPSKLSMAVWINKSNWDAISVSSRNYFSVVFQVYNNGWQTSGSSGSLSDAGAMSYTRFCNTENPEQQSTQGENDYVNYDIMKSKVLDRKTVNGEDWVCVGFVWSGITYNTSAYETDCRLRISFSFNMMQDATHDIEIGNMQVVESADYLDPNTIY